MSKTKKHVVAFLDILGFKEKTKIDKDENYINDVEYLISQEYISTINWNSNVFEEIGKTLKLNTFSDNIVASCEYKERNSKIIIRAFLDYVASMQYHFSLKNCFLRGGICIGSLYTSPKNNFICGQGLIDSYSMESKLAIYPRIVVSKEFEQAYDSYYYEHEGIRYIERPSSSLLRKDFDNSVYVDFYNSSFIKYNKTTDMNIINSEFILIRSHIIEEYINNKNKPNILQKYGWLVNYHNTFCQENSLKEEFLIKENDLINNKGTGL